MTRPIDKTNILVYTKKEKVQFDWNLKKAITNQKKHGVSFDLAITVFDDPNALIAPDEKHSTDVEVREWVISARKANRKERKLYEEFKKFSL